MSPYPGIGVILIAAGCVGRGTGVATIVATMGAATGAAIGFALLDCHTRVAAKHPPQAQIAIAARIASVINALRDRCLRIR